MNRLSVAGVLGGTVTRKVTWTIRSAASTANEGVGGDSL